MKNNVPDSVRPESFDVVQESLVEGRPIKSLKFSANLSMLFTEVDLPDRFQAAKDCGFSAVEIQFPYSLSSESIAEKLTEYDLKLVLFNVDAGDLLQGGEGLACVPEKQQQFETALAQAVDYARVLNPLAVNILPGRCLNAQRLPQYSATFKANLKAAAEAFAPLGVKAVFEAINTFDMPGFIVHNQEQMLTILNELSHPSLYLQYDIYHMARMGEDCADFIASHVNLIGHIQFADVPGRGQPGTGGIDFVNLFEVIRQSGYLGWCGAEYRPQGPSANSFGWFNNYKAKTC